MISFKNLQLAAILSGNKEKLRKEALLKRAKLKSLKVENISKKITTELFKNFDFNKLNVHLFYPISKNNEVNTWHIHNKLSNSKNLYTTIFDESTKSWKCISFQPKVKFNTGKFNIPFPSIYKVDLFKKIDIILIPLIVFDKYGNRIGYGKGVYDNILKELNTNCIKVGLSLFKVSLENIQSESHDIALDYCQTPNKLFNFKLKDKI